MVDMATKIDLNTYAKYLGSMTKANKYNALLSII